MKTMQELIKEYQIIRQKNTIKINNDPTAPTMYQTSNVHGQTKEIEDLILGYPESFDNIRYWMVDVSITSGKEVSEETVKKLNEYVNDEQKKHDYLKPNNLVSEIIKIMKHYNLTDSGCGCGHTDLGCHCTETEAKELINILWARFRKAIESKMVKITRKEIVH